MTDQTVAKLHKTRARAGFNSYPIADGVTVVEGMLCQLESGYLNHWDETGSFLGIVLGPATGVSPGAAMVGDDDADTTVQSAIPQARVDESGVTLMHMDVAGTPTQAKVGDLVFSADSNYTSLTMTDTTNPPVGRLVAFYGTDDVDVELFTPAEHAAGIADATWNA